MTRLCALLATLLAAPIANAAPAAKNAAKSGSAANVRTSVRGNRVRAVLDYHKGGKVIAVVPVPANCSVRAVEKMIAGELAQNLEAFRMFQNTTVTLPSADALPFGLGFGNPSLHGKSGNKKKRSGPSTGGVSGVKDGQAMIRDVLAGGTHKGGTAGNNGETCFDGYNLDVGQLVEHNNALATGPAKSSTVKTPSGSVKYTEHKDGTSTKQTFDSKGTLIEATSTVKVGNNEITVAENYKTGETTVTVETETKAGSSSVSTTSGPDGHSTTHKKTVGKGANKTTVTITNKHDKNGKHKGGKLSVESDGKKTTGTIAPDSSKDAEVQTASGKDEGNKDDKDFKLAETELAKIRMPSGEDGFANLPPVCIPDEMWVSLLNWNRLQEAVVYPSPVAGVDGAPGHIKKESPCGGDEAKDVDLDASYLMPNKQSWITDPAPHTGLGE